MSLWFEGLIFYELKFEIGTFILAIVDRMMSKIYTILALTVAKSVILYLIVYG